MSEKVPAPALRSWALSFEKSRGKDPVRTENAWPIRKICHKICCLAVKIRFASHYPAAP